MKPSDPAVSKPGFAEAFRFWLKLGFISFGGPTGQIAIMHTELVERKRWISEERFLHALNYCMLLPGPEAQQLAIYIGWLLHRTWGGIVAGALFVLPSALLLWGLSFIYVRYGAVDWVASVFYGLKPAVLAIVASAVIKIGRKVLRNEVMWGIAAVAFVCIYFLKVPFPLIIFSAAILGLIRNRLWPERFLLMKTPLPEPAEQGKDFSTWKQSLMRNLKIVMVCLGLWWLPLVLIGLWLGKDHALVQEGLFFSKAALVTFGGAYAVLPYVSQQAVENHAWLTAPQMLDGLGLAETTPGPLIMVLQFVGFLGGWNQPGGLSPLFAATLGAIITTWTTFVPCFLWIFLGAPYIEKLRGNAFLSASLSAVTAAVVGVILNLAVWFGAHVLFTKAGGVDGFAWLVAIIAFFGIVRWKWNVVPIVVLSGVLGVIYRLLF